MPRRLPDRLGNLFAVLADHSYLAPMRDGQYRLGEPLPDGLRRSVLRRDRFTCCDCRQAWSPDRSDLFLQVDHVVPVAAGGSDRTDNLRTLSEDCNQDKLDRYAIAVASSRPRLIVSWCYDCAEPDIEITGGITAACSAVPAES